MRIKKVIVGLLFFLPCFSFAQDKIYKTDNTIIDSKVTEVRDDVIKFKKFNNPDGPLYNIKKTDVKMIVYENGEKEIYNDVHLPNESNPKEAIQPLKKLPPEYNSYFSSFENRENGNIYLTATEKYSALTTNEKKTLLNIITKAKRKSLIMIIDESKRELWNYNNETESAQLLDEWDFNANQSSLISKTPKIISHPCFAYIGGQGGGTKNNAGVSLNLRLGFFLLKDKWDLAASVSGGATENPNIDTDTDPTLWSNVGLISRVHFPIRKLHISPNIGGEVTISTFGAAETKVNGSAVIGITWFIGFGSLDIGVRIGDVVSGMGGLAVAPNILKR